jgi:hypothetical protein
LLVIFLLRTKISFNIHNNFSQPFVSLKGNIKNIQAPIWNFSEIYFPDIGKERVLHISKSDKNLELFPPGVQLPENFTFDVEKYWQKLSCSNKKKRNDEDDVLELEYSFPACNSKSINARNWKEYKDKLTMLQENDKKDWMLSSPVSYLFKTYNFVPMRSGQTDFTVDDY